MAERLNRSKSGRFVILELVSLALAVGPGVRAVEGELKAPGPIWPQDGCGTSATGQSPFRGPHSNRLKWIFLLDGWACSPVIGADGTVYVGTNNGTLYAIANDGSKKWTVNWPVGHMERPAGISDEEWVERKALGATCLGHVFSCAVGQDGTVYAAQAVKDGESSEDRHLIALNEEGEEKWRYSIGRNNIVTKITLGTDGTLYFGTRGQRCAYYALKPNGKLKWSAQLGRDEAISSAAIGKNDLVYIGGYRLRALDSEDGSLAYEYAEPIYSPGLIFGPAIGPDGTIYIASGVHSRTGHFLYAFRRDLSLKWKINAGVMELTPAVSADGTIYIHTWGDVLGVTDGKSEIPPGAHAINPDGTVKWSLTGIMKAPPEAWDDNPIGAILGSDSPPIVGSDGVVYFGSDIGKIFAVRPDGTVLWQLDLGGEFDTRPAIDAEGTLYVCHAGGPGGRPDMRPRCYAINDKGTITVEPPKPVSPNAEIARLEAALERAKRQGNQPEVREIQEVIEDLRAGHVGDADEQDDAEIASIERIESLKDELRIAEAEGNELEVEEILQLLEELQAQAEHGVTAVQAIAIAAADDRVQELFRSFDELRADAEFAGQWQVWIVNFYVGDRHAGLASVSKDGEVLEFGRDEESDAGEQERDVYPERTDDRPRSNLPRSSGEYLGQKWHVDQDHLMWWDGKPYVPFGGFGIEPGNQFGLNTFNLWIDFDPFVANANYTREQHRADVAQKLDAITKAGGTCIVQFSMALPHIPEGPQPGMRWRQPEGGIDGSRLADPEVRRKILKVWQYYAPAVRKRCVRAVVLWNEINVWRWPEHTSAEQYGQILGEYARQVKRMVGDLPVCFKIAGTWRAEPVIAAAAAADGLGFDVWLSSPDDAHARRDIERALGMLEARQEKTAWFFIAEGGRGIAEDGSDEAKEPDDYWANWPPFRSKKEALGILQAYAQAGAKGFVYNGPTSELDSDYRSSYRWLGELQGQVIELMVDGSQEVAGKR